MKKIDMDRKFKLVKKYPNSPELDTIVQLDRTTNCFVIIKSRTTNIGLHIPQCQIICFPEFWKELFQIADGEVTEDDAVWVIDKNTNLNIWRVNYKAAAIDGTYPADRIFIHKENAEKKLEELQNKSLEYYERIVNSSIRDNLAISSRYFKLAFPKYYWLMVLQEIANDLNGDWKPEWFTPINSKFYILKQHNVYHAHSWSTHNYGSTVFKSRGDTLKAIEIMGDKLDYIFE